MFDKGASWKDEVQEVQIPENQFLPDWQFSSGSLSVWNVTADAPFLSLCLNIYIVVFNLPISDILLCFNWRLWSLELDEGHWFGVVTPWRKQLKGIQIRPLDFKGWSEQMTEGAVSNQEALSVMYQALCDITSRWF